MIGFKYQAYPEYKDSGVEWLGKVPEHWDIVQIKHLSPIKRGASPRPIDDNKYFDEKGDYAWTRIADVTISKIYLLNSPQKLSELGSSLSVKLEPGSLFLSIAGSVGKPCIMGIKACIHDGFVYFPDLKIPVKFLYYLFAGEQAYKGLGKFGTQLNLNTDTVGGIKIGLTTHYEQQKIANFLDHQTAKIDTLIEKQKNLIKLLKEKRQAVISHAVTKGLNPDAPMKDSGVEWLGKVPEHWEIKKNKAIFSLNKKQVGENHGDYQVLSLTLDGVKPRDMLEGGKLPAEFSTYQIVSQKDLIFCLFDIDETPRTVGIALQEGMITSAYNLYKCHRNYYPRYFYYYFIHIDSFKGLRPFYTGLRKVVRTETFSNIRLPSPQFLEQQKIANSLDHQTAKIDVLIAKATQAISLMQERRTALISAAVTGKIDLRNWQAPI